MSGGKDSRDTNDEPMESRYHQDVGEDEEEDRDQNESCNLLDNYSYDKWLQEQDPILIENNIRKLKGMFPGFKEQMIKNVLLRDDVKGDVEKAKQIMEEFQVMRQSDGRPPQQNQEPNRHHQGRPSNRNKEQNSRGEKVGGNRGWKGRGRGRGRGRQDREGQYRQNQRGPQMQAQLWPHPDHSQRGAYPPPEGPPHYPQHRSAMLFERGPQSCPVGPLGLRPHGPYTQLQPDHFQHPGFYQEYWQYPRFYGPQAPVPQNQRGPSNQKGRNNFQKGAQADGRGRNRGKGLRPEDKTGERRSSNESLQSNASGASGCSEEEGGRTRRGRLRNRRGKGRGGSDRQNSQEAPGALQTTPDDGGLVTRYQNAPSGCLQGRGRMGQARSFAAFEQSLDDHQSSATELEPNMLCVLGLSTRTTEENLTNFIEAKSGDEVLQIIMFGNGKALVVLANLTDFNKTKQKAEQRGLDEAQLEIRRVAACQTIHVSGLSRNTTRDALELYFENTKRSGGDAVDEVDYNTGDDKAVVHFTQTEVVERVLAKEHVLNDAKLVVRKYYPSLEEEEEEEDDEEDTNSKTVRTTESSQRACSVEEQTCKESGKTREEPAGQQLSIAVDSEKMECIMGSGEREKLVTTLEQQSCELQWKPGQRFALVMYHGKTSEWQDKCIEIINNFLKRFVLCKIPLEVNYSEGVVARLAEIRKSMEHRTVWITAGSSGENCLRMVCEGSNVRKCEEEINEVLQVIIKEEVKKKYKSTTIPDIPEENIALLNKLQFFEKLKIKNQDLEVNVDPESGEIHLEGPPDQFKDANIALRRQIMQITSRTIATTSHTLEVLSSDEGLMSVRHELQQSGVDAVFVFDPEINEEEGKAFVVGKTSAEAEKAADLIKNMTLEQKIEVEKESNAVLASPGWKKLKEKIPTEFGVRIHSNAFGDTWVTGFRHDVNKAVVKFSAFLDEHTVRRDIFTSDKLVLRYLFQHRRDALSELETSLLKFKVKINKANDEGNLVICGTKEGLKQLRVHLHNLSTSVEGRVHDVKQPGVKRLFTSGGGDRLVRSVERDHFCVIEVERKFGPSPHSGTSATVSSSMTSGDSDESSSDDGDVLSASHGGHTNTSVQAGANTLIITTPEGKTISWKVGDITRERADVLVASVASSLDLTAGPFAKAFSEAAGPALQQACSTSGNLKTGEILVTVPGNLACSNVILTVCCRWDNGNANAQSVLRNIVKKSLDEAHRLGVGSIAFPTLGTGNLQFPWSVAADVLTEQALAFSKRNPLTPLHDIRVIVFEKDRKSIQAFQSDIARTQRQYGSVGAAGHPITPVNYGGKQGSVSVHIVQGDITQESTDVIVNVNGTDMSMNNAGAVSKAIARASGPTVERECSQKGQQPPGAVVMTTAGNLLAKCIIHLIPASGASPIANMLSGAMGYITPNQSGRDDIENSVEKCLNLADTSGYQSISLPAVGTGSAGGNPQQSAQSMLRAVNNFSQRSPQNLRQVRIVIFQGHMVSVFQQEQQGLGPGTSMTPVSVPVPQVTSRQQTKKRSLSLRPVSVRHSACVRLHIYGKDKPSVDQIVTVLQSTFLDACTKQKVENEAVSSLSERQVRYLQSKATGLDVDIAIEPRINRIVVSGNPKDVTDMMGVVWEAIDECKEKKRKQERAQLVAKNVQWYYSLNSSANKVPFDKKSNAEIEVAQTEHEQTLKVSVGAEQFVIDIPSKRGHSTGSRLLVEISREVKGTGGDGIILPQNWDPMPSEDVRLVPLSPGSAEYQSVAAKFRSSGGSANVVQIERIQNSLLYRSYMVRKQKMDKENGGRNNERELWHGTASKNIKNINTQGFNRSFCGANGTAYGNGVYFARDASYSMGYAQGGQMYLARVLVGMYTNGRSGMIVPPAKDPRAPEILYDSVVNDTGNPSIYVVFYDSLCYPDYLVTFR